MRDIRSDLQERAGVIGEQIKAAQAHFEKFVEQIKGEHNTRINDLRSELDAVNTLMGIEHRRHGSPPKAQPQPQRPQMPTDSFARAAVSDMMGLRRAI